MSESVNVTEYICGYSPATPNKTRGYIHDADQGNVCERVLVTARLETGRLVRGLQSSNLEK